MKPSKVAKLKSSLTETMEKWIGDNDMTTDFQIYGSSLEMLMAEAAINILLAAEDMQTALAEGGYLKEEDE
jgi:hypothetical protein